MTGGYLKKCGTDASANFKFGSSPYSFFLVMKYFRTWKEVNSLRTEKDILARQASMAQAKNVEAFTAHREGKALPHDMRHHLSLIEVSQDKIALIN